MAEIFDMSQYRRPPSMSGPVAVSFHWPAFRDSQGRNVALNFTFTFLTGSAEEVISSVRELGGVWLPGQDAQSGYFAPWPPAGIEVRPAPKDA